MHRSDIEDRYRLRSSHFLRIGYRSDETRSKSDPVLLSLYYSVLLLSPTEDTKTPLMALFHCMVRYGSVRYGTAQFGSVAFPPQFSTAIEWAGLFTRRYNCAASTAVTSS